MEPVVPEELEFKLCLDRFFFPCLIFVFGPFQICFRVQIFSYPICFVELASKIGLRYIFSLFFQILNVLCRFFPTALLSFLPRTVPLKFSLL